MRPSITTYPALASLPHSAGYFYDWTAKRAAFSSDARAKRR
jgi:hypothetical protein